MFLLLGSLASLTAGIFVSWPSPSIPQLLSEDSPTTITIEEASYFAVVHCIAAVFSSPIFALVSDKFGRKTALLSIALPHLLSWIVTIFANSIWLFYVARVFSGIADGCLFTLLAMYLGEVATPKVRGSWGNVMTFAIYFGQMVINVVGGYCDIVTTAYILLPVPIVFFVIFSQMPESPYYLLMKNRQDEARKCLQVLRRKTDVEDELSQLQAAVIRQMSESGEFKDLFFHPVYRRALLIAAFLRTAQQFSGLFAFSIYAQYLFDQTGGELSATTSAIIFSGVLALMNGITSCTMDKFGRKISMVTSCTGCSIVLAIEAVFFYLKEHTEADLSSITWLPLTGLILYIIAYSCGLGLTPTLMQAELFSANIKAKGIPAITVAHNIYLSAATKICQYLMTNFGLFSTFCFFGVCAGLCGVVSYFVVPETKGKTLEEIQLMLKGRCENKGEVYKQEKRNGE